MEILPASRDRESPHLRVLLRVGACICVLLALFASCPSTNGQAERGNVDWIFVLDTSASMHGAGGTANIFGKVKETISDLDVNVGCAYKISSHHATRSSMCILESAY